MSTPIDRRLVEHTDWMRSLANALVGDPNVADDIAQDTVVAALERSPAAGNLRGWLGTVMGNALRQLRRGDGRRARREQIAAKPEAQPGVLDSLERAVAHRELVEELLELGEPFRTTLVLRFFEELPPREVARRLGVPVNTVRSRVHRGLAQMRQRLDRRHAGDRRAWLAFAVPLAREGSVAVGLSSGAVILNTKWKIGIAVAAVAVGAVSVMWSFAGGDLGEPAGSRPTPAATAGHLDVRTPPPDAAPARTAVTVDGEAGPRTAPTYAVAGLLVDASAAPLAEAQVEFRVASGASAFARSGVDGRFQLRSETDAGMVVVAEPGYTTLFSGAVRPESEIEPVVVAARIGPLAGRVQDADGRSIDGAHLQVEVDDSFRSRFTQVLDASQWRPSWTRSDPGGGFELATAPAIAGARLVTSHPDFRTDRTVLSGVGARGMTIVLHGDEPQGETLSGVVFDPSGATVAGARVALGYRCTETSDDGTFEFALAEGSTDDLVQAVFPGRLPGRYRRPENEEWPDHVRLTLGGPTESLSGRVVDTDGVPQAGAYVWVADPTTFGAIGDSPAQVENLLAGAMTPEQLDRVLEQAPPEFDVDGFMRNTPTTFWAFTRTDQGGRFRLEGLLERDYTLAAMVSDTLQIVNRGPFRAGRSDATIVLEADSHPRVTGRVVSRRGTPMPGVRVTYSRAVFTASHPAHPGRYGSRDMAIDGVTTDEHGRFELRSVPRDGVRLFAYGDSIMREFITLAEGQPVEDLEVAVDARSHFQVELDGELAQRADRFTIESSNGVEVMLQLARAGRRQTRETFPLVDGRSLVLSTAELDGELVIYAGETELARRPVSLLAGDLNVLR